MAPFTRIADSEGLSSVAAGTRVGSSTSSRLLQPADPVTSSNAASARPRRRSQPVGGFWIGRDIVRPSRESRARYSMQERVIAPSSEGDPEGGDQLAEGGQHSL